MIKVNDTIIIHLSEELIQMQLGNLAGKTGVIVEDLNYHEKKNRGYIVGLDEKYLNEYNWFIPTDSFKYAE